MRVGLYGFGAAAHILCQVARSEGRRVFAFTRPGDVASQAFARELGAEWAGGSDEAPPEELDAAIIFAPAGDLVPTALAACAKGGAVVCAGIHMSDIPAFPYELLWGERTIRSVANLTRRDGEAFMQLAPGCPCRPRSRCSRWRRRGARSRLCAQARHRAPSSSRSRPPAESRRPGRVRWIPAGGSATGPMCGHRRCGRLWSNPEKESAMHAIEQTERPAAGDVILVGGHSVGGEKLIGEILEVRGEPGHERYRVRWEDGHESIFHPADGDATIHHYAPHGASVLLMRLLDEQKVEFEPRRHPRTQTALDEAQMLHASADRVGKTLVVHTPEGMVRVVIPASGAAVAREAA